MKHDDAFLFYFLRQLHISTFYMQRMKYDDTFLIYFLSRLHIYALHLLNERVHVYILYI